jgi:hypothetical protein
MEVSCQFHTPATLSQGKEPPSPRHSQYQSSISPQTWRNDSPKSRQHLDLRCEQKATALLNNGDVTDKYVTAVIG